MWFNEKKIFVAGTDTDAGKTYVSIKILEMFRQNGLNTVYFKPVATGGIFSEGKLISEDVYKVIKKTQINESPSLMNPVIYEIPAAPIISSELSGIPISFSKWRAAYAELIKKYESIVVEGIGGVLVPLTGKYLVIDMIKELNLPVIIVSKPVLGTINHTLLTVRALRDFGIKILGIIVSHTEDKDPGIPVALSFDVIRSITGLPIIKEFPYEMGWE